MMETYARTLREIISDFSQRINAIPDRDFKAKPFPHKWSKQEIVGHLIDSAHNNLRRFICGQYESSPPVITYHQDFWVNCNQYQEMDRHEIVELWRLMNNRISAVLQSMPLENSTRECDIGTRRSLEWLADDYLKHMKHHLNQIISGSFDVVYKST